MNKLFGLLALLCVFALPAERAQSIQDVRAAVISQVLEQHQVSERPSDDVFSRRVRGVHKQRVTAAVSVTGLDWNLSNGAANSDVRFHFTDTNVIQKYPRTQIWRIKNRQQTGYYTTFFRTSFTTPGSFTGDRTYEGCHPYPYTTGVGPTSGDGVEHHWEIAIEGGDTPTNNGGVDDNGNSTLITKGAFFTQALRVRQVSGDEVFEYFYELPSLTKKVTFTILAADVEADHAGMVLVYGASPWTESSGTNTETLSGILRGLQNYTSYLSDADMLAEVTSPLSTAAGIANIHYLNLNPTPTDITDKSGRGHHPTWVNSNRPILYAE